MVIVSSSFFDQLRHHNLLHLPQLHDFNPKIVVKVFISFPLENGGYLVNYLEDLSIVYLMFSINLVHQHYQKIAKIHLEFIGFLSRLH